MAAAAAWPGDTAVNMSGGFEVGRNGVLCKLINCFGNIGVMIFLCCKFFTAFLAMLDGGAGSTGFVWFATWSGISLVLDPGSCFLFFLESTLIFYF